MNKFEASYWLKINDDNLCILVASSKALKKGRCHRSLVIQIQQARITMARCFPQRLCSGHPAGSPLVCLTGLSSVNCTSKYESGDQSHLWSVERIRTDHHYAEPFIASRNIVKGPSLFN